MWEQPLEPELQGIYRILRDHPQGLSEYELLELLRGSGPVRGLSELELFRVHFLLFHHLYRLRDRIEAQGLGTLDIHCLGIRLLPLAAARPSNSDLPLAPDPLADYYLNLDHLTTTTQEGVEDLLRSFWRRFRVYGRKEEALAVLGLGTKASRVEIRQRFRELSLKHHPDLGGNPEEFSRVAEAMSILRALGVASAA